MADEFSVRVTKITSKIGVSWAHILPFLFFYLFLTAWIMVILSKNLDDSIDSGNFSVTGYPPLIWKDSTAHIHGLAVYVKEGLPFPWDLSLENSAYSYLCFRLSLLHSRVLLLFPLLISFFAFMHVSVSSNIDDVLLINPSANMFVFGDLNVRHKDWLTYSGVWWTPLYFLLSQMALLKWLTFLLRSLTVTLTVLIFWICFFLFILVFVLQWLSLHWEILIILVS